MRVDRKPITNEQLIQFLSTMLFRFGISVLCVHGMGRVLYGSSTHNNLLANSYTAHRKTKKESTNNVPQNSTNFFLLSGRLVWNHCWIEFEDREQEKKIMPKKSKCGFAFAWFQQLGNNHIDRHTNTLPDTEWASERQRGSKLINYTFSHKNMYYQI